MEKTRIGVIGTGHMGRNHLKKYQEIEECTIVGISDIDECCVNETGDCYGCHTHTDHRDLIGKVDAVSITVPTKDHYQTAKDFLENGIDVLLEKPITTTLDQADELIALSRANGTVLQIGLVERFNPAISALPHFLNGPLFIEAHRLHPFFPRGTDVDVILDLMIHDLDIILHMVGSPFDRVDASGVSVLSDKIDIANARVTFENGCVANVTASRVTDKAVQKIRFFSKQGYNAVDYAKQELVSLNRKYDEYGRPVIVHNPVAIDNGDSLENELRSFLKAVRTRQQPEVTGEQARESLALGLEIIKCMQKKMEHVEL